MLSALQHRPRAWPTLLAGLGLIALALGLSSPADAAGSGGLAQCREQLTITQRAAARKKSLFAHGVWRVEHDLLQLAYQPPRGPSFMITVAATQPGESPGSEAWTSDPQFDDPRGGPLRARNDVQLARRHGRWNGVVNGFGLAPADVEQLLSFLPAVDGCLDKLQASR